MHFLTEDKQLEDFNHVERKKYLQKIKIIKNLYLRGSESKADICERFHISAPTSTLLLNQLMADGLVVKDGWGKSVGGRKPELYGLQDNSFFILGIHLDTFSVRMALYDNNNRGITEVESFPIDLSKDQYIFDDIHAHATELLEASGIDMDKLLGIGVCMPGLVTSKEGKSFTYFLAEQHTEPLQRILEKKFAKPVLILNDAKSACLAEFRFGLARNKKDTLVISMDWGIGLGIIMDGKMHNGSSGFAGEFGHIPIVENGKLCYCGKRGCLETVASGIALARMAKEGVLSGQRSLLNALTDQELKTIEPQIIIEAANKGDQYAINILAETGVNLGKGIAILIQLFNPELIILEGKIAEARQYITTPIQHALNTYCMGQLRERTTIALSTLGPKASIIGAVAAVVESVFARQIALAKSAPGVHASV